MEKNSGLKICQRCKAKCCKLGGGDLTKKEMQKIVNAGHHVNRFNKISENHYEFKNIKGTCAFLSKDNSCSIYDLRPAACKAWPVGYPKYKNRGQEFFVLHCPLAKHLSENNMQKMIKQSSKIPKEISENCVSKTKMPKEILAICTKRYNKFKKTKIYN